jgi:hypothetical protein
MLLLRKDRRHLAHDIGFHCFLLSLSQSGRRPKAEKKPAKLPNAMDSLPSLAAA